MKIALDPYMLRSTPLLELPGVVADLGYEFIELSPRADLAPFFLHPRVDDAAVKAFKKALDGAGVKVAAHLPLYRWSGPDEDERRAACSPSTWSGGSTHPWSPSATAPRTRSTAAATWSRS